MYNFVKTIGILKQLINCNIKIKNKMFLFIHKNNQHKIDRSTNIMYEKWFAYSIFPLSIIIIHLIKKDTRILLL